MQLTVDTTWWTRYRSRAKNPDFGDTFPQAIQLWLSASIRQSREAINDLTPSDHIQADRQHGWLPLWNYRAGRH